MHGEQPFRFFPTVQVLRDTYKAREKGIDDGIMSQLLSYCTGNKVDGAWYYY